MSVFAHATTPVANINKNLYKCEIYYFIWSPNLEYSVPEKEFFTKLFNIIKTSLMK